MCRLFDHKDAFENLFSLNIQVDPETPPFVKIGKIVCGHICLVVIQVVSKSGDDYLDGHTFCLSKISTFTPH